MKMTIDIQWGGFYASREVGDENYTVFRILDFNSDSYHAALYREKFSELPKLEDVVKLSPFMGHAPIDSKALARDKEIHLLGSEVIEASDLEGYAYFLKYFKVEAGEIQELMTRIIEFSAEPPMKLSLEIVGEDLEIQEWC